MNATCSAMYRTIATPIPPMIASGMFRPGLRLSPPSWTACSKPRYAKMTPPEASARKTPFHPYGMKPPPALPKFSACTEVASSATTVSAGTKSFQQTASLFVSASQRTPRALITQKSSSRVAATTYPWAVSTGRPPETVVSQGT